MTAEGQKGEGCIDQGRRFTRACARDLAVARVRKGGILQMLEAAVGFSDRRMD